MIVDCVDMLLQLPLTKQALAQEQHQKWANEMLDGSMRLMDVCSTAKEALLQTKECLQDLQSIIRRRGVESGVVTNEVRKYLTSRKMVKKMIHKAMAILKGTENRSTLISSLNNDNETIAIVIKLRDVEAVTLTVFESLLSFISGPKSKPNGWSLVSRMIQSKRVACEEETKVNEFAELDTTLKSLKSIDDIENQLLNNSGFIHSRSGRT